MLPKAHQDRHNKRQDGTKTVPRAPKIALRVPKDGSNDVRDEDNLHGPTKHQDGAKMSPRWLNVHSGQPTII
eukprot:3721090-Pyramimonas_sp.AAC.1